MPVCVSLLTVLLIIFIQHISLRISSCSWRG